MEGRFGMLVALYNGGCCLGLMDLVHLWAFGLASNAGLWLINGCLVGCHSSDLLSVEGLGIKCKPYPQCTRLLSDC